MSLHQNTSKDETLDPNTSNIILDHAMEADYRLLPNYSGTDRRPASLQPQINSLSPTNKDESIIQLNKEDEENKECNIAENNKQNLEKQHINSMDSAKQKLFDCSSDTAHKQSDSSPFLPHCRRMTSQSPELDPEKVSTRVKVEHVLHQHNEITNVNSKQAKQTTDLRPMEHNQDAVNNPKRQINDSIPTVSEQQDATEPTSRLSFFFRHRRSRKNSGKKRTASVFNTSESQPPQ